MQGNEILYEIQRALSSEEVKFFPPASKEQIKKIGESLNVSVPEELISILSISNGATQLMENPKTKEMMEIEAIYWSVDEIIANTLNQYQYLKTIDSKHKDKYLFFSDNGCGEHFGYKLSNGACYDSRIYVYYPIDDEYVVVAENFKEWATNWFSGKLST